jgi:4-aminobutyrate aminotransferase-like enzyme
MSKFVYIWIGFCILVLVLGLASFNQKSKYLNEVERITRTHGPWKIVQVGDDVAYMVGRDGRVWFVSDRGTNAPLVETKE